MGDIMIIGHYMCVELTAESFKFYLILMTKVGVLTAHNFEFHK